MTLPSVSNTEEGNSECRVWQVYKEDEDRYAQRGLTLTPYTSSTGTKFSSPSDYVLALALGDTPEFTLKAWLEDCRNVVVTDVLARWRKTPKLTAAQDEGREPVELTVKLPEIAQYKNVSSVIRDFEFISIHMVRGWKCPFVYKGKDRYGIGTDDGFNDPFTDEDSPLHKNPGRNNKASA